MRFLRLIGVCRSMRRRRAAQKSVFEKRLLDKLIALDADFVVLDGLLVILDELVRPGAQFYRRIANIHPGVTRLGSPYERRGAYATLDALYGARGQEGGGLEDDADVAVRAGDRSTGASFHYVDNGIDSGEVIFDVLEHRASIPTTRFSNCAGITFSGVCFLRLKGGFWLWPKRLPGMLFRGFLFSPDPGFAVGLLALPLSGAGVTFFAAAKKVTKESSSFRPAVTRSLAMLASPRWPSPKCRPQRPTRAWLAHGLTS